MKKEIKIKKTVDYIPDEDIQDAIEKNSRKGWLEYYTTLEQVRDKRRKKLKLEKELSILVVIFIIIVTIMTIILSCKMTEKARKNCILMGHSESYCYEKL